jgi:hypothetical protein
MTASAGLRPAIALERLTKALPDLQPPVQDSESLTDALTILTNTGLDIIEGAEHAAVSVRRKDVWETVAATSPTPLRVDALQYQCGSGPCVDAVLKEAVLLTDDLEHDPRWPEFGPMASAQTGVRSMMSVRMYRRATGRLMAGINFYSEQREAFTLAERTLGLLLAGHGALILACVEQADEVSHLRRALDSNRDIGAAIGILMAMNKITKDQAFDALRVASQHSHRKLRDVAQDVIDTGTLDLSGLGR